MKIRAARLKDETMTGRVNARSEKSLHLVKMETDREMAEAEMGLPERLIPRTDAKNKHVSSGQAIAG